MTDEELIETLWSGEVTLGVVACAAVRIEQLVNERGTWQKEALRQNGLIHNAMLGAAKAEAKLAKAVDALQTILNRWDTPSWKDAEPTADVINRARAMLAELEKSE
jgi:broad specificity phosphatase PhoE